MGVKISKLFKDNRFQKLPNNTKLLYIYLASNSSLNNVGVLCPNLETVAIEVGCSIEELRNSTKILRDSKYIYIKKYNDVIYFIVPEHFNTIPKSEASVLKIQKTLKQLPDKLVTFLNTIEISIQSKIKTFIEPTSEEVSEYALSFGYLINGEEFIKYYKEQAIKFGKKNIWVDGRGNQVNDWKGKLRKVWFNIENKINGQKDAPKGFELFYVKKDGKVIQPDGWKNGKPYSKSLAIDVLLKKEYAKRKTNS